MERPLCAASMLKISRLQISPLSLLCTVLQYGAECDTRISVLS